MIRATRLIGALPKRESAFRNQLGLNCITGTQIKQFLLPSCFNKPFSSLNRVEKTSHKFQPYQLRRYFSEEGFHKKHCQELRKDDKDGDQSLHHSKSKGYATEGLQASMNNEWEIFWWKVRLFYRIGQFVFFGGALLLIYKIDQNFIGMWNKAADFIEEKKEELPEMAREVFSEAVDKIETGVPKE